MVVRLKVDSGIVERLRRLCLALPETREERAWVGTRWCVRAHPFAHVVAIDNAWPPAYAAAANSDGPLTVLTFRSSGPELVALANAGAPFFKPVWFSDIVGVALTHETDWTEIAELLTESYCCLAPRKLVAEVRRADR